MDHRQSAKAAVQLSYQTLEGLEITIKSVVECIKFCLNEGVSYALTERFNQDPVEQHFGIHRIKDGCNTTPTLEKFDNSICDFTVSQAVGLFAAQYGQAYEIFVLLITYGPRHDKTCLR